MAKVSGPLFSLEARGKIADSVVYFPWKGRHVVRQWLKPTNKKSTLQGYVRAALKAIGLEIAEIWCIANKDTADAKLYSINTEKVTAGMNWNAFHAKGFLDLLQSAGTFVTGSFTDLVVEYSSLVASKVASFESAASNLGMDSFAFEYGYTTPILAGCQLYFGALAAYHNSLLAAAPYNTNPNAWDTGDIGSFEADHHTA